MTTARTGTADLPLHGGRAPRWLFERMVRLAGAMVAVIVENESTTGMFRRLSDPYWFQAFGCVLGFDWHSSGLTTTVCGAIKESLYGRGAEYGLFVAGGKGLVARRTPHEVTAYAETAGFDPEPLIATSRLTAKVDSAALQDGYSIYHHVILFDRRGEWCVVQQGMNDSNGMARRYHWLGETLISYVKDPHAAVCCDKAGVVLNMVAEESEPAQLSVCELARGKPEPTVTDLKRLQELKMPTRHPITIQDIDPKRLESVLIKTYERQPQHFQELLGVPGIGPAAIRALALMAELAYGTPASSRDPARYSFAHGGKDGYPYPVNRKQYDQSIAFLEEALRKAHLGNSDKIGAFRRLASLPSDAKTT